MRYIAVLLSALLLAGCVGKQWHHTNPALQTNEVFARDQADCTQHARAVTGEPVGQLGDYEYAVWRGRFNLAFNRCMVSRGWYLE